MGCPYSTVCGSYCSVEAGRAGKKRDRDTRKLLTLYGGLHLKPNVSEIYLFGERRLIGVKE